ncbi:DUF3180 domain-containing protein [Antrihabitans sp. NCIMB 15449]|jgi:hypothetical protein|uniref:DUF3180 domain-containing protein n=2 Tax=Antrihabitans TaxID=2799491 RepID=A0A934NRN2_9NOCA|nr:DUF3180 domain-containing protein [Antrihabitans stalagmiti]MBJ8340211.1 DUF3180 domain-containing protein [Antrihabitans stalagmiti]
MKPTRIPDLVVLLVFATAATWLLVRVFYGQLPPIPVYAGASLYPVAVVEVIAAFIIRSRVNNHEIGDGLRQLHPITAARAVALAKASALVGAASAGVWLGFLLYVFPQRDTLSAAVADSTGAIVGLAAGVVLVVAALWLEHCCKAPEDPPDEPAH